MGSTFYYNQDASGHLQIGGGMKMKIQQIKIEFHVTPQIKRYVYVYLLITENGGYLIDSGVAGSEGTIEKAAIENGCLP